jgi:1-acyl-sn-glycerol-3-phosphate acyltransferase
VTRAPLTPYEGERGSTTLPFQVVTTALKGLTGILCRVNDAQLAQVPDRGPLILIINHVNFLEAPVIFPRLQPRPMTGFAKAETWDNLALRLLADLWDAIPIQRGEADVAAMRRALAALEAGYILIVAPEGTRSGAPLLPLVYHGGERFWDNLHRLRRTDFHIVVGQPFYLSAEGISVTGEVRHQMADEIMYQMAALLPPAYRGMYSDLSAATETYLRFPTSVESNLRRVRD